MKRFAWAAVIVAIVALGLAGLLVWHTLTSPRGYVAVGEAVPPYFVLLTQLRGWLPVLLTVGLGAAICIPFALAVQWNRSHRASLIR
jgi:hypothetical protein